MYKVCKNCGKQFDLSVKKCPECGGKLKKQFTEEELEEHSGHGLQNDSAVSRQWMEAIDEYLAKYMPIE